jgi:phosphohistidine phosphatase
VSPATRTRETASALGVRFATTATVGTNALVAEVVTESGWPEGSKAVLIVGHQPTLGRVAAALLSGSEADWHVAKGAVWWLRHSEGETRLVAVVHPKLV